jgi:Flp pilus assembly pilin Flp
MFRSERVLRRSGHAERVLEGCPSVTATTGFAYSQDHAPQIHPALSVRTPDVSVHRLMPEGGESAMTLSNWFTVLRAYARREEGQTMAEYAVVLTVIAAFIILALGALAFAISGRLDNVTDVITGGLG